MSLFHFRGICYMLMACLLIVLFRFFIAYVHSTYTLQTQSEVRRIGHMQHLIVSIVQLTKLVRSGIECGSPGV